VAGSSTGALEQSALASLTWYGLVVFCSVASQISEKGK